MKKNIMIILALLITIFSCIDNIPKEFSKYQSFDEYKLDGVTINNKIISPYIFLKENLDTISVIISNEKKETIKYLNKGSHWYNIKIIRQGDEPNCFCDTTPYYVEKFIFNDTILTYSYYKNREKTYARDLAIDTKKTMIKITINDKTKINEFTQFQELSRNYMREIPYWSRNSEYQPSFYQLYEKEFRGDTLFLYERNIYNNKKHLSDVRLLNSLGEFDPNKGVSIIDKIQTYRKYK